MPVKHEQELTDFAEAAAKLAKRIHQEWGSGAPAGGFQTRVNVEMPKRGPDHALQNIERQLGDVINAIEAYMRRPRED
jgi:hypothetical protein